MTNENIFGVKPHVWRMWTPYGRELFNWILTCGANDVPFWNAAFVAACEESGLNVEYEARHG